MLRPVAFKRTAAAAVVGLALLGACSNGASSADGETSGIDLSAQVDRVAGNITFPADRLGLSVDDEDAIATAQSAAIAECAQALGVNYHAVRVELDPIEQVSTYFGVWREQDAEHFGFVTPQTPADMEANEIAGAPEPSSTDTPKVRNLLTSADRAALTRCQGEDTVQRFGPGAFVDAGPWNGPLSEIGASFYGLEDVMQIEVEYNACLSGAGLAPHPDLPGSALGAESRTISAEQIKLALEVVACKDRVDYVSRLADVMAAEQAPIIQKYATDMLAFRKRVDALVAEANSYTAAHKDLFTE